MLATGVQARLLQGGGVAGLLQHYHAELLAGLRQLAASGGSGGGGGGGSEGGPVGCPEAAAAAVEGYSFEAMLADYKVSSGGLD